MTNLVGKGNTEFEMFLIETRTRAPARNSVGMVCVRASIRVSKRGEKKIGSVTDTWYRSTRFRSFLIRTEKEPRCASSLPPSLFSLFLRFPLSPRRVSLTLDLSFCRSLSCLGFFATDDPPYSASPERCGAVWRGAERRGVAALARLGDADSYRPVGVPHSGYMACHPEYYSTA